MSFQSDLAFSEEHYKDIEAICAEYFEGFLRIEKTPEFIDRQGTDIFVHTLKGTFAVDIKARRETRYNGRDMALELDNYGNPGWCSDPSKICDLVLVFWADTKKYRFLPYRPLRIACMDNLDKWEQKYFVKEADHENSQTACCFVPFKVIFDAMGIQP